jgi:preprotein translocase subunit SecY
VSIVNSFQNVFRIAELKSRILFTLALLAVYRIGAHIPTPGINGEELSKFLLDKGGALMGFFDMFSGGALSRATIFALGIMPYISASIILQLLTVVIPALGRLAKEGEAGRKKITDYDYHDIRHCFSHVAGRADHRAWYWQRDIPYHICRHCCAISECSH